MAYQAGIVLDSMGPSGVRLTTATLTFPRFVLAEFNTHRMFSRNAASSRAIPTARLIEQVREDPVQPVFWGENQKGMVAEKELDRVDRQMAIAFWESAKDEAVEYAQCLAQVNVHKQIANRLLEPFLWTTVVVTGIEAAYANFFHLRCAKDAQPELREVSVMLKAAMKVSEPRRLEAGEWHLPFIQDDEVGHYPYEDYPDVSAARCARVSYLTHEGKRDWEADMQLAARLRRNGHWSPLEHPAMALGQPEASGNFVGWAQYRKWFDSECVTTIEWGDDGLDG